VSRYQKGETDLDFTEARDSEWQWHQLGHMQVCTSDNQITTPAPHHSKFFTGRMPFMPPNQQHQSTEGITVTKLTTLKTVLFGPPCIYSTVAAVWANASMLMLLCLQFAEEVSDSY